MVNVRPQREADCAAVHELVRRAFEGKPYAGGNEPFIVDALWRSGAACVALVAEADGAVVGQAAFSAMKVAGRDAGWHVLGPVAVLPERQRQGVGSALIRAGLERLRALGSKGCAVVGDPGYYRRFGFANTGAMRAPQTPPEHFSALALAGELPGGEVTFDAAFEAAARRPR